MYLVQRYEKILILHIFHMKKLLKLWSSVFCLAKRNILKHNHLGVSKLQNTSSLFKRNRHLIDKKIVDEY